MSKCIEHLDYTIGISIRPFLLLKYLPVVRLMHFEHLHPLIFTSEISYPAMLFYEYFKTLVGTEVVVYLKNSMGLSGVLVHVDSFLNIRLENAHLVEGDAALAALTHCSIRGSAVKLIRFKSHNDRALVDATRLRCCLGK